MNAIEIKDLCKNYPTFAISNLNLTLPTGCVLGLVGENGAGKSTTMKLILDIVHADKGSVTVLGRDNKANMKLIKEEIGIVPDEVGLPVGLNSLQIGRIMKGSFRRWDDKAYCDYLRRFHIPNETKFGDYSRGMKMKLGIAVALSHHPRLLILDEPTSGLDPLARDGLLNLLTEYTRDERNSILISSHIVSDLEKICDYIAFLHKGRLLLCDEKDRLLERYGVIRCTAQEFNNINKAAVIGKKESPYGVEAIAERRLIPKNIDVKPVDIEQLFVSMVKEDGV